MSAVISQVHVDGNRSLPVTFRCRSSALAGHTRSSCSAFRDGFVAESTRGGDSARSDHTGKGSPPESAGDRSSSSFQKTEEL